VIIVGIADHHARRDQRRNADHKRNVATEHTSHAQAAPDELRRELLARKYALQFSEQGGAAGMLDPLLDRMVSATVGYQGTTPTTFSYDVLDNLTAISQDTHPSHNAYQQYACDYTTIAPAMPQVPENPCTPQPADRRNLPNRHTKCGTWGRRVLASAKSRPSRRRSWIVTSRQHPSLPSHASQPRPKSGLFFLCIGAHHCLTIACFRSRDKSGTTRNRRQEID
jgi:hypothetical protein